MREWLTMTKKKQAPRGTTSLKGKTLQDFPEVLLYWHPNKNGALQPSNLPVGSTK
jgi:hypothetical protein